MQSNIKYRYGFEYWLQRGGFTKRCGNRWQANLRLTQPTCRIDFKSVKHGVHSRWPLLHDSKYKKPLKCKYQIWIQTSSDGRKNGSQEGVITILQCRGDMHHLKPPLTRTCYTWSGEDVVILRFDASSRATIHRTNDATSALSHSKIWADALHSMSNSAHDGSIARSMLITPRS